MTSEDIFINPHAVSHWIPADTSSAPDTASILAFHSSLPGYAPTPLVFLESLSRSLDCQIYLKDESSRLGLPSFKILGASWGAFRALCERLGLPLTTTVSELRARLSQKQSTPSLRLYAATDGNHGRAVAYFASLVGIPCTIYVPASLPESTVALIRSEGSRSKDAQAGNNKDSHAGGTFVIRGHGNYDAAVREAAAAAESSASGVLVQDTAWSGYETIPRWIVEGYGTMMAEIEEQCEGVNAIVCPVGVGSLASAVVGHFAWRKSQDSSKSDAVTVLTVEPTPAACLFQSLCAGYSVVLETSGETIMSGMDCGTVSSTALPLLKQGVAACITVTDQEAHVALQSLQVEQGIRAGPCGAAAIVGVTKAMRTSEVLKDRLRGRRVVLLCTEGEREYDVPEGSK